MATETSTPLWLTRDTFVCSAAGTTIALVLRSGRYLSIDGTTDQAARLRVSGWPGAPQSQQGPLEPQTQRQSLRELIRLGLLTEDARAGKTATPVTLQAARTGLMKATPLVRPAIPWPRIPAALRAVSLAKLSLHRRSLKQIVAGVGDRRRARCASLGDEQGDGPLDRAAVGASAFETLVPFLFSAHNQCLLHSLALIEFLAVDQVFPPWVFGVRTYPFAAHCWIQQGSVVLNDAPENVRAFTPIMVV